VVARIHELVRKYPRYGYRMITAKLRQEGWHVNFKRIYRLWRREGLKVPKKTRKRRRLGHSGNSCVRRCIATTTSPARVASIKALLC
jgi:transposase InsO family protein